MFKEDFHKLLKQEWNYLKKQLIQKFSSPKQQAKAAVPEKQLVVSQKQSVVNTSKQQNKTEFKELEIEKLYTIVYTGSLQTQSYIQSSQKPWGNPLSNHTLITYTTTKRMTLNTSKNTLSLANTPT